MAQYILEKIPPATANMEMAESLEWLILAGNG